MSFTSSARVSSRFSSSSSSSSSSSGVQKSVVRYVYHQNSIINRRRQNATRKMIVGRASSSSATMQKNPDGFEQIDLFSPSKINLFLRIVRRREDGYHDLASLFHVIDLGDEMSFAKSSSETKDTLVCEDTSIPLDDSNLVIKALNLFRQKTGIKQYF